MKWIKVEDKLPKDGQEVLYYFEILGIFLGKYQKVEYPMEMHGGNEPIYGNQFYGKSGFLTDDVTHWMPLPEPPETFTK